MVGLGISEPSTVGPSESSPQKFMAKNGRLQFWHDEEERTELASLLALISGGWLVAMGLCQAVSWLFGTFECC